VGDKQNLLKQLGQRIKELRLAKNMTQAELAGAVNKEQQSIQRLEAGKVNPSFIYLSEIAEGLDVSVAELTDIGN
jgi:putative transcriptional regulator